MLPSLKSYHGAHVEGFLVAGFISTQSELTMKRLKNHSFLSSPSPHAGSAANFENLVSTVSRSLLSLLGPHTFHFHTDPHTFHTFMVSLITNLAIKQKEINHWKWPGCMGLFMLKQLGVKVLILQFADNNDTACFLIFYNKQNGNHSQVMLSKKKERSTL